MEQDERLQSIYDRGDNLRRRRTRWRAAALGVATVIAVLATLVLPSGGSVDDGEVRMAGSSSSTAERTSTTLAAAPTSTTEVSAASTSTTSPPTTTTTPLVAADTTAVPADCRDSYDGEEKCGPWYWDPEPGPNEPMTITITTEPVTPAAGSEVDITVEIRDPDHSVDDNCLSIDYGDGSVVESPSGCFVHSCPWGRAGPHTPPPRESGEFTGTYPHTYEVPGEYVITVTKHTSGCHDPYASDGAGERPITVRPVAGA